MIGKVGYSYSHELLKHIEKVGNTINKGGWPMDFRELTTDVLVIGGGGQVALLAEGVDRNTTPSGKSVDAKKVALLAEGVDRNYSPPNGSEKQV